MTRSEHNIERELDVARADLQANLSELKETVKEKLDVKKRLRDAVDRNKVLISAIAGAVGLTTLALIAYNRRA